MEKKSTLLSYNSFLERSKKNLKDRQPERFILAGKRNYAEKILFSAEEEKSQAEDSPFPHDAVIANILNFSKSLFIQKSQTVGLVEIVLN